MFTVCFNIDQYSNVCYCYCQCRHYHPVLNFQFVFCSSNLLSCMMSPSGNAYMGRQVPQRDEELNQIQIVLKYIFDAITVTEMKMTFRCPL